MTVVKTTKETICNMCGKEFDVFDAAFGFHVDHRIGFGSKHDMEKLDLDLCCSCFDALIDACKISPVRDDS